MADDDEESDDDFVFTPAKDPLPKPDVFGVRDGVRDGVLDGVLEGVGVFELRGDGDGV